MTPSYLSSIEMREFPVQGSRTVKCDFGPEDDAPFKHLVLTGKNGSGKSVFLGRLVRDLDALQRQRVNPNQDLISVGWTGGSPLEHVPLYGFIPATRSFKSQAPQGPTRLAAPRSPGQLHQYLVNLRTQVSLARDEGNLDESAAYRGRLEAIESALATLFEQERESFALEFQSRELQFRLRFGDMLVPFEALPDGFKSALSIWASLFSLNAEWQERHNTLTPWWGIFLIDEVETHLHLSLQEAILPFLTKSFPTVQFVVATHSPAVVSSLSNAMVWDLSSNRKVRSEEFLGVDYGTTMRSHFGIATEFDRATSQLVGRLEALVDKVTLSEEETNELEHLKTRLLKTSTSVAAYVWQVMEKRRDQQRAS